MPWYTSVRVPCRAVDVGNISQSMRSLFGNDTSAKSMDYTQYLAMAQKVRAADRQPHLGWFHVCACTARNARRACPTSAL